MSLHLAALSGLILSIALERMLLPRPNLLRAWATWSLHIGIWLLVYGLLVVALGRPWFAMALITALFLVLVQVNNAKMHSLREPFVFQDYEYFTDAIRHPRLYIPFLGWGKFAMAIIGGAIAISIGLWGEPLPSDRWSIHGQFGEVFMLMFIASMFIVKGHRSLPSISINPMHDSDPAGFSC